MLFCGFIFWTESKWFKCSCRRACWQLYDNGLPCLRLWSKQVFFWPALAWSLSVLGTCTVKKGIGENQLSHCYWQKTLEARESYTLKTFVFAVIVGIDLLLWLFFSFKDNRTGETLKHENEAPRPALRMKWLSLHFPLITSVLSLFHCTSLQLLFPPCPDFFLFESFIVSFPPSLYQFPF